MGGRTQKAVISSVLRHVIAPTIIRLGWAERSLTIEVVIRVPLVSVRIAGSILRRVVLWLSSSLTSLPFSSGVLRRGDVKLEILLGLIFRSERLSFGRRVVLLLDHRAHLASQLFILSLTVELGVRGA